MTTRRRSSMNIGVGEEGFGPQGKSMERTPLKSFQNGLCASSSTLTPLFSKLKIKENKKHLNLNSMPSCPVSRIDFSTEAARKASAIESHLQPLGEMGEFKENAEPLRVTEDDRCSLEYRFPDSLPVLPAVGLPQSEAVSTQLLPGRGTAEETYVVDESPVDTVPGVTTGRVRDRDEASQGNVTEHLSGDSLSVPKADSSGEINSTMDAVSLEFLGADVEIWDLPEASDGTTPDSTVGQANGSTFIVQASDPEELQTLNETTHLHGTTVRGEAISAPASRFGSSRAADGHSLDISMKNVSFLSDNPYVDAAHDYCVAPAPVMHKAGGSEIHPAVLCLLERQPDTLENMQSEEDDDASPTALPGVPVALSSPIRNALAMQDQTDQFSSADTKNSPFAEDLRVNAPGTEQAESLMPLGCSPVAPKQSSASLAEGSRVLSVPQSESQEEDSGIGNVLSSEARSLQLATEAEAELPFEADPSASLPRPSLEGSISESFQSVLATPVERAPVVSRSVSLLLKSLVNSSDNQAAGSPAVGTGRGSDGRDPDPRSLSPAADSEHDFFGSGKRKLASPGVGSLNKLWRASPYSPFPQPQLNSTAASLGVKEDWDVSILSGLEEKPEPVSSVKVNDAHPVKASMVGKPDKMGVHAAESLPGGGCSLSRTKAQALQQQLLQMAEILMFPLPSGAQGAPASSSSSVELCPVGTCTTPVHRTERSVNTSGVFESKREISVAEMGTNTDSLLWNLPDPESLQALPRADLEMRLTSALIVMEALSQQVASARARGQEVRLGPSSLRETFVQTDLTELSQVEHDKVDQQYRELYVGAVQRVQSLELPQEELQALLQRLKDVRDEVFSMSTDTAAALTMAQETFDLSKANQDASAKQMSRMKGLHGRSMEMLRKMREKVVESQRQRDGARQQVEEALRAKEAAHAVAEALRCHSAARIRELEQSVGSHQELVAALRLARPEQDALNDGVAESLQSFEVLCEAMKSDGLQMREQWTRARDLLKRTFPVLSALRTKTDSALREREDMRLDVERANEERNQIQGELAQSALSLQDATQEIGDLRLKATIMNSELTVLTERLREAEQDRALLQRENQELSTRLSSAEAWQTQLSQALSAETERFQLSVEQNQQSSEYIHRLESMFAETQRQVDELTSAVEGRDAQLSSLQKQLDRQSSELEHQEKLQAQLSALKEMNEFLQEENTLSREQVAESETMVKSNLQALRQRNLECEDLRRRVAEMRAEQESLQEEVDSTRARARSMLLSMGEQLSQSCSEARLLHDRLQGLADQLKAALRKRKPDTPGMLPTHKSGNTAGSFVGSVLEAVHDEDDDDDDSPGDGRGDGVADPGLEAMRRGALEVGSGAFVPIIPKKAEEVEERGLLQVLSGVGETVSELFSVVSQLQALKAAEQEEMQQTITKLQDEREDLEQKYTSEVCDLKDQIELLQIEVQKANLIFQYKAEKEKETKKLSEDLMEYRQLYQQQKSENAILHEEQMQLERSLKTLQVEAQAMKEELSHVQQGSGQGPSSSLQEKILLRKEVESLKCRVIEVEESKRKLLERAKRHQTVYEENQRKSLQELKTLDEMIETVRKTLGSVPDLVAVSQELQALRDYLG